MTVEKKTVLITGASSGIGHAVAVELNNAGYRVVLVARREYKLNEIACNLTDDTICIPYDLNDLSNIEEIFLRCSEAGIKLYGLIHCAGINRDQPIKNNDLGDMYKVMNINLLSFIELAKFFCRKKYSIDGSVIVAISSAAVYGCEKGMCTYTMSKAGIDSAVKIMSKEFAKRKIRANSIQPSFVDTPMAHEVSDYKERSALMPLGVIEPVQIAYLVEFLLSIKAKHISGSNIKISSALI